MPQADLGTAVQAAYVDEVEETPPLWVGLDRVLRGNDVLVEGEVLWKRDSGLGVHDP